MLEFVILKRICGFPFWTFFLFQLGSGGQQQTGKTVAIVVGGAAALFFGIICLLFIRALWKKKEGKYKRMTVKYYKTWVFIYQKTYGDVTMLRLNLDDPNEKFSFLNNPIRQAKKKKEKRSPSPSTLGVYWGKKEQTKQSASGTLFDPFYQSSVLSSQNSIQMVRIPQGKRIIHLVALFGRIRSRTGGGKRNRVSFLRPVATPDSSK